MFKKIQNKIIAILVFVLFASTVVWIWHKVISNQENITRFESDLSAAMLADRLEEHLLTRLQMVETLRLEWQEGGEPDAMRYQRAAESLLISFIDIHKIQWLDAKGTIRWSLPDKKAFSEVGLNVMRDAEFQALLPEAANSGRVVVSSVRSQLDERTFTSVHPLLNSGQLMGFILAEYRLLPTLNAIFRHDIKQNFAVRLLDVNQLIYQHGNPKNFERTTPLYRKIILGNRSWDLSAVVAPKHQLPLLVRFEHLILVLGLALSLGFSWLLYRTLKRRELMKEKEQRYYDLTELMPEMVCELDPQMRVLYANQKLLDAFGYSENIIKHGIEVANLFAKDERFAARKMLARLLESDDVQSDVFDMQSTTGETFTCESTFSPRKDASGQLLGYLGIMRDVSLWQEREQQLEQLSHYDNLTGVPNKSLFKDRLVQAMGRAERLGSQVAILMVDIDRFKLVNESLGHTAGDLVLKGIANRLSGYLRQGDTLARYGDDEFVLLLADVAIEEDAANIAMVVARKVMSHLLKPFMVEGKEVFLSASIGISLYPQDTQEPETLIRNADAALTQAKSQGKNQYQFFIEDINTAINERVEVERRLRYALKKEEFELNYQPIIQTSTGKILSFEAFLCWKDPVKGKQLPENFLHMAEESGLIIPIGKWVLRQACEAFKQWQSVHNNGLTLAINVSIRQLQEPDFLIEVRSILADAEVNAKQVELEINEDVLFDDKVDAPDLLNAMSRVGLQIALDDFGIGLSSLSNLMGMPVNIVKIDQSYTQNITQDKNQAALVSGVIAFAHQLGLKAVAEGVETREQYEQLKAFGCDAMQGFYFSQILTAEEAYRLTEKGIDRSLL